jgi:hypothetical protein
MSKLLIAVMLATGTAACAVPRAAGAPLAPVERAWAVPNLELYQQWWAKTEACANKRGELGNVAFYAVDAPSGAIKLGHEIAQAWWVRSGNRIYLPANALGEEWLVRHEMLHALLQTGTHPPEVFVDRCHLASAAVWRDSTLTSTTMATVTAATPLRIPTRTTVP